MAGEIIRYLEPLNGDERAFLQRRERKERGQLLRAIQMLMSICFILPFAMAWGKAIAGKPNPFSIVNYFIGVFILATLCGLGCFIAYRRSLYRIHLDLQQNSKTVERSTITRKRYMPQTNTFFFFVDSPTLLSIEVSQEHFEQWEPGDEVNIEYSTHARLYLGYF